MPVAENDPYANLLNINQIDDIPLYPEMERLSLDPNKVRNMVNAPKTGPVAPIILNPPAAVVDTLPAYVPYTADYVPYSNSMVYPDTEFKELAKPQNFMNDPVTEPTLPEYTPLTLKDPNFDQICEDIRKGL